MMLQFADRQVSYATFVHDVAKEIASLLHHHDEYISQNEAFRRFGRANVERWRRNGMIKPSKRPGKVEYSTAQLQRLKDTRQDYFTK